MKRHLARRAFTPGALLAVAMLVAAPAAADAPRPIEGHGNWKLGMTKADALVAEPRAEPKACDGGTCLHYPDERFPTTEVDVSARFAEDDFLDAIVITMKPQPGGNRCRRIAAQLAAFYTAAHGEIMPASGVAWVWSEPRAALTLLNHCDGHPEVSGGGPEEPTINILFEALERPGLAPQ
jgi:hypothetical protein